MFTECKSLSKSLLHPTSGHYLAIEMIMQDIVVYFVKQTMESVLESLVSKYESYFTHNRNMDEKNINVDFINMRHLSFLTYLVRSFNIRL